MAVVLSFETTAENSSLLMPSLFETQTVLDFISTIDPCTRRVWVLFKQTSQRQKTKPNKKLRREVIDWVANLMFLVE